LTPHIDSIDCGRVVTHHLEPGRLQDHAAWLGTRRSFWHGQLDTLTTYLERP